MKINTLSLIITLSGILFVSVSFLIIILGKKVGEKGEQKIKIKDYVEVNTNSIIFLILIMSCLSLAPLTFSYWKPNLAKCIDELSILENEINVLKGKNQSIPIRIKVMDSNKEYNVYNAITAALEGTNTQEILGVLALKKNVEFTAEIVNPSWRDYDKVIQENPDILIIHNSSFKIRKTELVNGEEIEKENDYERIFTSFLKSISLSTTTQFLIYSRKEEFKNSDYIINKYVKKIPNLKNRISVLYVKVGHTFLKPEVAVELSDLVDDIIRKIKEDRV